MNDQIDNDRDAMTLDRIMGKLMDELAESNPSARDALGDFMTGATIATKAKLYRSIRA